MKKIDITDRLSFDESPKLVIKGKEIEVNDDAVTMLKVMDELEKKEYSIPKMAKLLFGDKSLKTIGSLKLSVSDFSKVIDAALDLISAADEEGDVKKTSSTT